MYLLVLIITSATFVFPSNPLLGLWLLLRRVPFRSRCSFKT
jgi:hypothetical protein